MALPEFDAAAIFAQRFRILTPNLGEEEARFRSFDYAVAAYRARCGVSLEDAKQAVLGASKWRR